MKLYPLLNWYNFVLAAKCSQATYWYGRNELGNVCHGGHFAVTFFLGTCPFLRKSSELGQNFTLTICCMKFRWFGFVRHKAEGKIVFTGLANYPRYNTYLCRNLLRVHQLVQPRKMTDPGYEVAACVLSLQHTERPMRAERRVMCPFPVPQHVP